MFQGKTITANLTAEGQVSKRDGCPRTSASAAFKDADRKRYKQKQHSIMVGKGFASFFSYFVKKQEQVTFTDDNEPSFHRQLIKPTLNLLINKVTPATSV